MESTSLPKVLCVDDDRDLLDALTLILRRKFRVATATSGAEGLAKLRKAGPFAVVLSDMRMPAMDGVGFLTRVRDSAPDTVRMVLTGNADVNVAIHAVNEGRIFRFLAKPCPPKQLLSAFEAALEQYRMVTAERLLLEETLRGSIKTLSHILAITNPPASERARRVKQIVAQLAKTLEAPNLWEIEAAAMLSQIGCVTLSVETTEKLYRGKELSDTEEEMVARLPQVTDELLRDFPGLRSVREILDLRDQYFDGRGTYSGGMGGDVIPPLGARLLKLALDYDALAGQSVPEDRRLALLYAREGSYDPGVLEALEDLLHSDLPKPRVENVSLAQLRPGMILVSDIVTTQGSLLVPRDNEITREVLQKITNFKADSVKQPIRVVISDPPHEDDS